MPVNLNVMRAISIGVLIFSGCAPSLQYSGSQQFSGHWSIGPAYSWFTPTGSSEHFIIEVSEIPEAARNLIQSQPTHPTWSDGPESSIYLTVDGFLEPVSPVQFPNQPLLQQLHVQKVTGVEPPHDDFVKSRKKRPPAKQAAPDRPLPAAQFRTLPPGGVAIA